MSGYNKNTGIFELTYTKACHWFRRKDVPSEIRENYSGLEFVAEVLKWQGLTDVAVSKRYAFLSVRATPGQLWEALSGQPSDPEVAELFS